MLMGFNANGCFGRVSRLFGLYLTWSGKYYFMCEGNTSIVHWLHVEAKQKNIPINRFCGALFAEIIQITIKSVDKMNNEFYMNSRCILTMCPCTGRRKRSHCPAYRPPPRNLPPTSWRTSCKHGSSPPTTDWPWSCLAAKRR